MGTLNNIYVLNYLINRQLGRKGGKVVAIFADLKAAYNMVDREVLFRLMRKRGIRERLIERVEEVYRESAEKGEGGNGG